MTTFVALTCPQCGSSVTRATNLAAAAQFHDAHARACAAFASIPEQIRVRGQRYQLLAQIGAGSACDVFFAQRLSPAAKRVVIKLARDANGASKLQVRPLCSRSCRR